MVWYVFGSSHTMGAGVCGVLLYYCVYIPLYNPKSHGQRWYCDPVTEIYAFEVKKMLYMTKTRLQCGAKHELVTKNVMYPRELSP